MPASANRTRSAGSRLERARAGPPAGERSDAKAKGPPLSTAHAPPPRVGCAAQISPESEQRPRRIEFDPRFAQRAVSTITPQTANPLRRPTLQLLQLSLHHDLAHALETALATLPPDDAGLEAWAVGGAVRDVALDRALVDLDIATTADPGPLAVAAARALEGTVEAHP